jgi:hypothetical protein
MHQISIMENAMTVMNPQYVGDSCNDENAVVLENC